MNQLDFVRRARITGLSVSVVICLSGNAQAFGVGGYVEYGNVDGEIELLVGDDVDFDADQYGVGVVFDSNLARDSLFNYRGTFGYRRSEHTFETFLGNVELDADGFEMNHLFGFGVVRTNRMRIFIGPAIRIGADDFDTPNGVDLVNFDIGIGPEIGMNVHLARHLTVSPWIAYQFHYLVQSVDVNGVGDDIGDGYEHVVKAGLSIFWRSGSDQYRASQSRDEASGRTD